MNNYPSLQRSVSPRLRNTNQAHDYPSRRHSVSSKSLASLSRQMSCPPSLTPRSIHLSFSTLTSSMPQMQYYNELNKLATGVGTLSRLGESQSEQHQEIGVICMIRDKPLRGRSWHWCFPLGPVWEYLVRDCYLDSKLYTVPRPEAEVYWNNSHSYV